MSTSATAEDIANYDRANHLLGTRGAAFRMREPDRYLIGVWRELGAFELPEEKGGPILRSKLWCFVVYAQGTTWAEAWEAFAVGYPLVLENERAEAEAAAAEDGT